MKKFVIIYQNIGLTELCPIEKIKNLVGENAEVRSNFSYFNEVTLKNHFKPIENLGWSIENFAKAIDGLIYVKNKEENIRNLHREYYDECKKQNTPIRIINL